MWDGAYAGVVDGPVVERTRLFEDAEGRLVAALLSFGDEEIHPQLHPSYGHLEGRLIEGAEALLRDQGEREVKILCWDDDAHRGDLLAARGYRSTGRWCALYRRALEADVPSSPRPAGYRIRTTMEDGGDDQRIADLQNHAFDRTRHTAEEMRRYREHAPSFRRALDLVAEAPNGELAAYVAVAPCDPPAPVILEPVCTHPDHRRRGLARHLIYELMRRAARLGATHMDVGTNDAEPAHALYRAVGFGLLRRGTFHARG